MKSKNSNWDNSSLTIKNVLNIATKYLQKREIDSARLTAELLLAFVLNLRRIDLYINYNRVLEPDHIKKYWSFIKRRIKGEPIHYIIGKKEFWSLELDVNQHVFIPRPETELLVEYAIHSIKDVNSPFVLDLCTGSGAIAIAIAKERPDANILAVDISLQAIEVAQHNARKYHVLDKIKFLCGDLWEPLKKTGIRFHLIVSNPPYVAKEDYWKLPVEVREWEPRIALDGGTEGISIIKRIIEGAKDFLHTNGYIFIEMAPEQTEVAMKLLKSTNQFKNINRIKDYSDNLRIVKACKDKILY